MNGIPMGRTVIPIHRRRRLPPPPPRQREPEAEPEPEKAKRGEALGNTLAYRGSLKRRYKALAGEPSKRDWTNAQLEAEIARLTHGS